MHEAYSFPTHKNIFPIRLKKQTNKHKQDLSEQNEAEHQTKNTLAAEHKCTLKTI
jgi:hypothetical protein